jgi:peptidoglycan hydrolase CwlO-like protein
MQSDFFMLSFSAQHDYESERREREEKIQNIDEQITSLKAQQHTTSHQMEQFRSAVTKYKADEYKLKYVLHIL